MSVEVFNPEKQVNCTLRDLPNSRFGHTLCGGLLCGGVYNSQSCLLWDKESRTFVPTEVQLSSPRSHHLCWKVSDNHGIILIGGTGDSKTSELVVSDGSSSITSFDLQYPAAHSCGIDLGEKAGFVILGGVGAQARVSVYAHFMWQENLAGLNKGRSHHACSMFTNSKGNKVFLVNGGKDLHNFLLSSTELFDYNNRGSWINIFQGNLHTGIGSHRILTINNNIYLFGGKESAKTYETRPEIWMMNTTSTEVSPWLPVWSMLKSRYDHAVDILEDVESFCP